MQMITFALSKGRIFDEAAPLLARAGIVSAEDPERSRRLIIATLGLLLVVLVGFVLYVCASILQPLFIAGLLVYMILPLHQRLVKWRVPSAAAYLLRLMLNESVSLNSAHGFRLF